MQTVKEEVKASYKNSRITARLRMSSIISMPLRKFNAG